MAEWASATKALGEATRLQWAALGWPATNVTVLANAAPAAVAVTVLVPASVACRVVTN